MEEYMSELSTNKEKSPFQRIRVPVILIAVLVAVTGLVYAGGYFLLPGTVKSAYQDRDCEKVLSREGLYTRLYPAMIADKETSGMVRECAVYILATRSEESGMWRESFDTYRVYTETYPQGLFAGDAHEHAAVVLITLARDEVSQEKYSEAEGDILSLLEGYADTAAASEAVQLKTDLQMGLGARLRESGDFAGAEQVFKEVNAWAQENKETEFARSSQLELAQTYLEWGQALQERGMFPEAKARFDTAAFTDPDPASPSGPAAQVKGSQAELYIQWGAHLIRQKDFANAMMQYEAAGKFLGETDPAGAKDIIVKGYVQWATEVISEEDFLGALVLLDFAEKNAETAFTKRLVDDKRSDLYLAFSRSEGEQAKDAMADAVRIACEHHTQSNLPIFARDSENILAGIDGVEDQLPESVVATTPATLHYAACIDEDTKLVGTLTLPISTTQFGGPPGVVQVTYGNYQYVWNVVLRYVYTGEEILLTVIEGVPPADLIPFNIDATTFSYYGARPDIEELARLIQDVAK
jgi:tetratricopeptide (TPR) repeat protein